MKGGDINQPAETIDSGAGGTPDVDTSGMGVVDGSGPSPSELPMNDPFDGLQAVEEEERFETWDDAVDHREAVAEGKRLEREEAEAEAAAEAAREAEREAKNAEMEEAHANGDAYYWGDTTYDGQTVQEWYLPDGTRILVDASVDPAEAVSVTLPADSTPVYQGDIFYDGEVCAVYELATGAEIVIDSNGTTIGMLDELEPDEIVIPGLEAMISGQWDGDDDLTVQLVPTGPPDYNTEVIDADTGEVVHVMNTGGTNPVLGQSVYHPPGADYFYVMGPDGEVLHTLPEPVEPEWSILGIVEYYEDGTVSVDLGLVEFDVDLVGPEKGISVTIDLIIVEGTAGIEWNEDGSWEFSGSAEVDLGALEAEGEIQVGQDENGNPYIDVAGSIEMQMGLIELDASGHAGFQLTDDGFEAYAGASAGVSAFDLYANASGETTMVLGDEGFTMTNSGSVGWGMEGVMGWEFSAETQFHTDGTLEGSSATAGIHFGAEIEDGFANAMGVTPGSDTEGGVGVYAGTDDGVEVTDGKLDTGRDYVRESDDDGHEHTAPTGDADFDVSGLEAPETDDDVDSATGPRVGAPGERAGAAARRADTSDDDVDTPRSVDLDGGRTGGAIDHAGDDTGSGEADRPQVAEAGGRLDGDGPGDAGAPAPPRPDAFDDITTRSDAPIVEATQRADAAQNVAGERPVDQVLVDDIADAPRARAAESPTPDRRVDTPESAPDRQLDDRDRRLDDAEDHLIEAVFEPNDAEVALDEVADVTLSEPDRSLDEIDTVVDRGFGHDDDQADGM